MFETEHSDDDWPYINT